MVFTLAYRITGNREDAEEIAQDTFVKAYQGLAGYKASSKFSTWLYAIAYNHSISFIRKKHLNTCSINNFDTKIYDTIGEEDSMLANLDNIPSDLALKAIQSLDELDKVIVTLYYQDECPVKEIAKITELSIANIKIRLFRGRKKILAELKRIFKTELVDLL